MKISPIAILLAVIVIGVSIEAVEQQNKPAAYALAGLVLLGMVTFNAKAFSQGVDRTMAALVGLPRAAKTGSHQTSNKGRN